MNVRSVGFLALVLALAATSASAKPRHPDLFVFQAPGAAPLPCPGASRPRNWVLRHEITPHPDLPGDLEICGRASTRALPSTPGAVLADYTPLGPMVKAAGGAPGVAADYALLVLSDPVAGHEREFNAWYNTQHIPDVLANPGFRTAQRYRLAGTLTKDGPRLPRYAVVFTIATADLDATMAEVRRRLASGQTRPSPYFDMKGSVTRYYQMKRPGGAGGA